MHKTHKLKKKISYDKNKKDLFVIHPLYSLKNFNKSLDIYLNFFKNDYNIVCLDRKRYCDAVLNFDIDYYINKIVETKDMNFLREKNGIPDINFDKVIVLFFNLSDRIKYDLNYGKILYISKILSEINNLKFKNITHTILKNYIIYSIFDSLYIEYNKDQYLFSKSDMVFRNSNTFILDEPLKDNKELNFSIETYNRKYIDYFKYKYDIYTDKVKKSYSNSYIEFFMKYYYYINNKKDIYFDNKQKHFFDFISNKKNINFINNILELNSIE